MFETIRAMVNQKVSFRETAELLTEEATELPIDRLFQEDADELFDRETETEPTEPEGEGDDDIPDPDNEDDEKQIEPENLDDMMSFKFSPAGEPVSQTDDDRDLLSVTLDLQTNTNTDVLPVPPMNAGDAVNGDMLSTVVDDGFSERAKFDPGEFEVYDTKFVLPEKPTGCFGGLKVAKLTDEAIKKAVDTMTSVISSRKCLKKFERDILEEERDAGESGESDRIRRRRIERYLGQAKVDKFICNADGSKAAVRFSIQKLDNCDCAWPNHELWLTSEGRAASYDELEKAYKEATEFDLLTEAITIDSGEDGDEKPGKKAKADAPEETDTGDDETNSVTDAVMDKVADSEFGDGDGSGDGSEVSAKLQERLDKLQKDIIGVKEMIRKSL